MDEKIYMSNNDSYIQRSAQASSRDAPGAPTRSDVEMYETIHDPPIPGHAVSNANYSAVDQAGSDTHQSEYAAVDGLSAQAYEVPVSLRTGRDAGNTEATAVAGYSQLQYK